MRTITFLYYMVIMIKIIFYLGRAIKRDELLDFLSET